MVLYVKLVRDVTRNILSCLYSICISPTYVDVLYSTAAKSEFSDFFERIKYRDFACMTTSVDTVVRVLHARIPNSAELIAATRVR